MSGAGPTVNYTHALAGQFFSATREFSAMYKERAVQGTARELKAWVEASVVRDTGHGVAGEHKKVRPLRSTSDGVD